MAERYLDGAGAGLSFACPAHCLALPVAAAALPQFAFPAHGPEWLHLTFLMAAFGLACWALVSGFRLHGSFLPLCLGAAGLALMAAGWALHDVCVAGTALTVAGVIALLGAHLRNWRLRQSRRKRAVFGPIASPLSIPTMK